MSAEICPSRLGPRGRSLAGRFFTFAVLGLILVFLFRHRREFEALRHIHLVAPRWLAVSLLAQALVLLDIARQLQLLARALGFRLPLSRLLRADLHRVAVSTVTPFGAAVGAAVFARDLEREADVPLEVGLTLTLVYGALGVASFVLLLPFSLFLLPHVFGTGLLELLRVPGRASVALLLGVAVVVVALGVFLWRYPRSGFQRVLSSLRPIGFRTVFNVLALALAVDLLNVVILWSAFAALGSTPSLGEVLVGYQASYVFAFVVPFAQGSGAVEFAGLSFFTAIGIRPTHALAAVLLWRAHELWFPFALGSFLWLQREPLVRRAVDRLPAILLFWSGFVTMFGLLEQQRHRVGVRGLERTGLLEPWESSRNLELVLGFLSIIVAFQVWRRKRTGWLAALAVIVLSVVHQLLGRVDPLPLGLSSCAGLLLLARWCDYRVRSDIPSVVRGVIVSVVGLTVAALYGTVGLVLLSHHAIAPGPLGWIEAARVLANSGFGFSSWKVVPLSRYGAWFLDSVSLVVGVALLNAVWSLGRPVVWRSIGHERERQRARTIIERCGNSSLDFFKYWPDKMFFFGDRDAGVVSFRTFGRVALVLGDPNACDDAAFARMLGAFLDFCEANDWEPAFHQTTERYLEAYRRFDLRWLKIGEEAIVDLVTWSLDRHGFKDLRYLVRRLDREGYRFEVLDPPLEEALLDELEAVSREWLTVPGRRERYFTQGQFVRSYLRTTPVAVLRHPNSGVVAFANLVPSGVRGEATIDLMRRRHEPYGSMDVLLAHLLAWCRDQGFRRFSLGLAPLAGVDLPGLATDGWRRRFYRLLDGFFSIEGLRHYKAKFQPEWEPRYIVFRSTLALPMIGLALLKATTGDAVAEPERGSRMSADRGS
ncbi:MAG: GNAT family N-acetyltransferase [Thermomicrobium sp.]|nr:GNAT family N-acetyltransferase [Thermomicrobium sp.]